MLNHCSKEGPAITSDKAIWHSKRHLPLSNSHDYRGSRGTSSSYPGDGAPSRALQEQQQSLKSAYMAGCKPSRRETCPLSATLLKLSVRPLLSTKMIHAAEIEIKKYLMQENLPEKMFSLPASLSPVVAPLLPEINYLCISKHQSKRKGFLHLSQLCLLHTTVVSDNSQLPSASLTLLARRSRF